MRFYHFTLPLPVSINAAHTVRRGEVNKASPVDYSDVQTLIDHLKRIDLPSIAITLCKNFLAKHTQTQAAGAVDFSRSKEYRDWLNEAAIQYRKQFPGGVSPFASSRIRVDYVFVWVDGARGTALSDVANREKALSDFLQKKFYENDNQIDENSHYRRLVKTGKNHVIIRVTEIPDRRHDDVGLIFAELDRDNHFPTLEKRKFEYDHTNLFKSPGQK